MNFILSVVRENGESSATTFLDYKTAKVHYGRIINERRTVSAILKDDSPRSRIRWKYERGLLK